MSDRLAARRPPTIRNLPARTRRSAIGAVEPVLASTPMSRAGITAAAPRDSGLIACAYPLATQDVPAAEYPKLRAEFAGSRFADLRTAGTAYIDLATALLTARGTDGYQTVWFYQQLSAACASHER